MKYNFLKSHPRANASQLADNNAEYKYLQKMFSGTLRTVIDTLVLAYSRWLEIHFSEKIYHAKEASEREIDLLT